MRYVLASLLWYGCIAATARADEEIGGKTVKELTAALKHKDVRIRYSAIVVLYEAGAEAKPLVLELARALKDTQPLIRRAAAQTLGNLKEDAAPAAAALVAALKDADPGVRHLAGQALSEVGEAAAPSLIKLLDDKDATIRLYVVMSMSAMGLQGKEVARALGKAAKDTNVSVRRAALFALSKIESEDVYALLGEAMRDKEQGIRQTAVNLLVGLGKESTHVLAKSAEDPAAASRLLAIQGLAALGEELEEKGILALRKALDDKEARIRQAAVAALANQGPRARTLGGDKEMFAALAKLLQDKDVATRRAAVHALGKIGTEDADEIKVLAVGLSDKEIAVRVLTVQALAQCLGEGLADAPRQQVHRRLIDALGDADRRVQFMAAQALASELERVIEPLTRVVDEGKGPQRLWAATILGEFGPAAGDAVPALQKMSRDTNPTTRQIAQNALQKIQPP